MKSPNLRSLTVAILLVASSTSYGISESLISDMAKRYRDVETGTFLTPDPLGFVDGPNRYTYVTQNPWTKVDPLGLETGDIHKIPQIKSEDREKILMHTGKHMLKLHGNTVSKKAPGGHEIAVRIFKDSATAEYTHGDAVEGDKRSVEFADAPTPESTAKGEWEQAGWSHTHPSVNDPKNPIEKQEPFSYSTTEATGDKAATQMGQFSGLAEFPSKNVFVYDQVSEFPDYATDGSDPRSQDFDFNKFMTEGTVSYIGNTESPRAEVPAPKEESK